MEINNTVLALPTAFGLFRTIDHLVYLDYLKDFDYLEQLII
jgi:hypothetical protein